MCVSLPLPSQTLGRVGQIVSVFPDGDIKLKLPGHERHWTFNPESVSKVEPDGAPLTPSTTGKQTIKQTNNQSSKQTNKQTLYYR